MHTPRAKTTSRFSTPIRRHGRYTYRYQGQQYCVGAFITSQSEREPSGSQPEISLSLSLSYYTNQKSEEMSQEKPRLFVFSLSLRNPNYLSGSPHPEMDPGDNRKWAVLVATIWIQAFTGTNFDFSAYSSLLKSGLQISQVQLSYLAVASDFGKALGWSSGLALRFFPLPLVLFSAATMGLLGYGLQWLAVTGKISLSYFSVSLSLSFPSLPFFVLSLLNGRFSGFA